MTTHELSIRRCAFVCVLVVIAFLLLIVNWRSPLAIRFSSGNVDLVAFLLGVTVLPLILLRFAPRLGSIYAALLSVVASCMLIFSAAAWIWDFHDLGRVARGLEIQPLRISVPLGKERISVYEVETSPAGAYMALRRQHNIIPGLLVSREFAVIDAPVIDKLTLAPHGELCVTFPSAEADATSAAQELKAVLPIQPLFKLSATIILVEPMNASVVGSADACTTKVHESRSSVPHPAARESVTRGVMISYQKSLPPSCGDISRASAGQQLT
jgi:hypothetical protein